MAKKLKRGDGAVKMISAEKLKKLLDRALSARRQHDEVNTSYSNAVKSAVEVDNLHSQAFAQIVKLKRMDAVKLRSFLDSFDYYRDVLELDKAKAADLFKDDKHKAAAPAETAAAKRAAEDKKNLKKAANGGIKKPKKDAIKKEDVTSGEPVSRSEAASRIADKYIGRGGETAKH